MVKPASGSLGSSAGLPFSFGPSCDGERSNFSRPPWPQRLQESQYHSDSLFPIPPIPWKRGVGGCSRTAEQRLTKFANSYIMANECIDGLNE